MSDRKIYWRCFHCGEAFTKAQERWAREHFGADEDTLPVCQMRVPGEHHLLTMLRKMEAELSAHRAEDTDLWRSLYAQAADHAQALRREEERGYEKGLADGRAALENQK
jgi:flagellar biosynthesis/type III secretory pathway protein FliH